MTIVSSFAQKFPDIYQDNLNYALKKEVKKNIDGKTYSVLTYEKKLSFGWQLSRGVCVLLATLCSLGTALFSKKIQWTWKAVWTGKGKSVMAYREITPHGPLVPIKAENPDSHPFSLGKKNPTPLPEPTQPVEPILANPPVNLPPIKGAVKIIDCHIRARSGSRIISEEFRASEGYQRLVTPFKNADRTPWELEDGDYLLKVSFCNPDPILTQNFPSGIYLPHLLLWQLAEGQTVHLTYKDQPLELKAEAPYTENHNRTLATVSLTWAETRMYHPEEVVFDKKVRLKTVKKPSSIELCGTREYTISRQKKRKEIREKLPQLLSHSSSECERFSFTPNPSQKQGLGLDWNAIKDHFTVLDYDLLTVALVLDCPGKMEEMEFYLIDNHLIIYTKTEIAECGIALIDLKRFNIPSETIQKAFTTNGVLIKDGILQITFPTPISKDGMSPTHTNTIATEVAS